MRISLLTPVGPGRDGWLTETAAAAEGCRRIVAGTDTSVEWVLCLDGTRVDPAVERQADRVVAYASNRGLPAARNAALAASHGDWVIPLDSDDLVDVESFPAVVSTLRAAAATTGWVAFNRLVVGGGRTPYWIDTQRSFEVGTLAEAWTTPFPFHPNSVALRRDLVLALGGWPATLNEDIGALLLAGEEAVGAVHPALLTFYRIWDGQITADPTYHADKQVAFATIEAMVNALRTSRGRDPISAPDVSRPTDLRAAAGGTTSARRSPPGRPDDPA